GEFHDGLVLVVACPRHSNSRHQVAGRRHGKTGTAEQNKAVGFDASQQSRECVGGKDHAVLCFLSFSAGPPGSLLTSVSLFSTSLRPNSVRALRVSSIFCWETPPCGAISTFTLTRRPLPVANFERTLV